MPELTAARENILYEAANTFLDARRTGVPIEDLPLALRPANEEEAFAIQDVMMVAYGEIGGWKIGARTPDGVPFFAPMPEVWMGENGSLVRGALHRLHGVEAEIAFQIGHDLPPREIPYMRDEVIAAIAACSPAIEIIESALLDPLGVARETMLADMQMHGGFIAGPPVPNWREVDWASEQVTLLVNGSVRMERTGSNPGGADLLRLLMYLANEGATRTKGLKAGQWITTGSWTGVTWTTSAAAVKAEFAHAGSVSLQFDTGTVTKS